MKIDSKTLILTFLFLLLYYFPVFHHLERLPILLWDESLFALRALYIHLTGEYLFNFDFFEGMPDHPNTKLPFTTLLQVAAIKVIGINELAIRLPTVLVFSLTVFYIIHHFKQRFNFVWAGCIFGLVAITSIGFVQPHLLRTGDQDAPFACYMLLATISFLSYSETLKAKPLFGFIIFSLASVLTKNLLAGLLVPGILVYVLLSGRMLSVLKDYKFWLASLSIIGVYASVVYYYEMQYNGFFERMWNYELMGRYTTTIEDHYNSPFYYLRTLAFEKLVPYLFLIPMILYSSLNHKLSSKLKNSILCFSSVTFFYLLFISFSKTQTHWYAAPIYLFGSYVIALGSIPFFKFIKERRQPHRTFIYSGLVSVWLILYVIVLSNTINPKPRFKGEKYGLFMKVLAKDMPNIKEYSIVDNNFGTSAGFYKEMYNKMDRGFEIEFQREIAFQNDQVIMTCLNNVLIPTYENYNYDILKDWEECKLIKILSDKEVIK